MSEEQETPETPGSAAVDSNGCGEAPKKKSIWTKNIFGGKKNDEEEVDYEALVMASLPEEMRNRKPVATIGLIATSVLMAIVMLCKFGSLDPDPQAYVALGGNLDSLTFGGQLWRLFTSSFLHFGIKHLAFNMLCLFSIGIFLEKLIGSGKLFSTYLLTAFTGGILSCCFHENTVCAGASGAVFGLFGASVAYIGLVYKKYGIEVSNVAGYMINGLIFIGINFLYSLMPDVDMACHIGGLLGGFVVGGVLAAPVKWTELKNAEWYHRGVTMATAILGLIMLITFFAAGDAGRMSKQELTAAVSELIEEKMTEGIKETLGAKKVSVDASDLTLFHDGGDNYHGLVEIKCNYDGEKETAKYSIKVTYDGENIMYELKE